jgi:hypothetical protein
VDGSELARTFFTSAVLVGAEGVFLTRRPTKVAAIALANKIARIAWAMMAKGARYKEQPRSRLDVINRASGVM